jgi:outer membrane protein TolC
MTNDESLTDVEARMKKVSGFAFRHAFVIGVVLILIVAGFGCSPARYRRSADKEVYKIIQQKEKAALGETNAFTIDTAYSYRKPEDVKAQEIIADRTREAKHTLTLPDALRIAVEKSREYQLRKEDLYLSALSLTGERFVYVPQFFAGTDVTASRAPGEDPSVRFATDAGLAQALKTGGRVAINLANDIVHFYSGGRSDTALSTIALSLSQPLLRGAGAKIAAENLTQAERDVIYAIRDFSYYQDTFAFDIVETYLRLVQQQDTVRNQYQNFLSRVSLRERSVALAVDRLAPFQADMAAQEELTARNSYIVAVERYQTTLDQFKITLGLPAGYDIRLDETVLTELEAVGLLPVPLIEEQSFRLALERRPDLLNQIDRFEDRKRKIVVAADQLKPSLVFFADASVPANYANFRLNDYAVNGGLRFDLPLSRKLERNSYRDTIINYERQLRALSLFLDQLKSDLRDDLRTLDLSRQTYDIQNRAKQLADRRVESNELSLQAGRIQVRDVVDAQTAKVQAYNAATAALVEYHLARMRLLLDLGILKTEKEKFWLDYGELPKAPDAAPAPAPSTSTLITPEELFKK